MNNTPMLDLVEEVAGTGYGSLWFHEDDVEQLAIEIALLRSLAVSARPSVVDELRATLLRERTPRERELEKAALKAIHQFLYDAFNKGVDWAVAYNKPGADSVPTALAVADEARAQIADILRRTGLT